MSATRSSAYDGINDDRSFFDQVKVHLGDKMPNFSQTLNIAVIGKVSGGKSSLINAILKLSRKQALDVAQVGAVAGVTKNLKILKLDDKVCLIDSPGLDDVRAENSQVTQDFLKHIDIGIFVITGASDASQKRNLDQLREYCDSVFVVLNKVDEWDDLHPSALTEVIEQWKTALGVEKIYPTCARGYDPKSVSSKMDIRGVYQLRTDIEEFLQKKGKDLLLARHMAEKSGYAVKIISATLVVVAGEAFIPGSAAWITATQGSAITALNYVYTGEVLPQQAVLSILPTFVAQTAGQNLFLFVKSFLPPTGVIDIAASAVAVGVTLALLATVNHVLSTGAKLDEAEVLASTFKIYRKHASSSLKEIASILKNFKGLPAWTELVTKFLKLPVERRDSRSKKV